MVREVSRHPLCLAIRASILIVVIGLGLIYGGRVLAGIGVGAASNLTPIYISEISPPAIRGRLVGLYELGWQIGGLVGFWINYGVSTTMPSSHIQWLIPFIIQIPPAILLFIGTFFIKESPRWLFSKGKREDALKNLAYIRNLPVDHIYMQEEISAIDIGIEHQKATMGLSFMAPFKTVLGDKRIMYRFFLGGALFFWQNGSGINAISTFSSADFSLPVTNFTRLLLPHRLQIYRCYWHKHQSAHHWYLWSYQDHCYIRLAPLPD
jgi:MFS family permease